MESSNIENNEPDIINQKDENYCQPSNIFTPQLFMDAPTNNINADQIMQQNAFHSEEKSQTNELSDENEDNIRKHLKRRSKKDFEGRNFVCKFDEESILSSCFIYSL